MLDQATESAVSDRSDAGVSAGRASISLNFASDGERQRFGDLLAEMKGGATSALDTRLATLALNNKMASEQARTATAQGPIQYVVIDVTAKDGDGAALLAQLQRLGLEHGASFGSMASGLIRVDALERVAGIDNVAFAQQSVARTSAGDVDSQVDPAGYSDDARTNYSVDGTGIKVGCISDSFNRRTSAVTDMADDIASGDLPADTVILEEMPNYIPGATDEGRALAQVVHDVAPGASIMFATGKVGMAAMAQNILDLAAAGCKVIVDDVHFFSEPAYQDGVIAQAIDQVVANGVVYLTSAYNNDNDGWEGEWHGRELSTFELSNGQTVSYEFQDFSPGVNNLAVFFEETGNATFTLKWDQPSASAGGAACASDLDLFIYDPELGFIVDQSINNNVGADATEFILDFQGEAGKVYYLLVGHRVGSGSEPGRIKLMAETTQANVDLEDTAWNLNDGTIYGHAAANGSLTVGSAHYFNTPEFGGPNPPTLSEASSMGPTTILFDVNGVRLTTPDIRMKPDVIGIDGGNTTFFGTDIPIDPDSFPNFGGTSASAPHLAGVAALMLDARSNLSPEDIWAQMVNAAIDMDDPRTVGFDTGFDTASGAGMVNANLAVQFAKTLQIRNDVKEVLLGTHLSDQITGATGLAQNLAGGGGNDRYYVKNAGAGVFEASGQGSDTVFAAVNFVLGTNQAIEILQADAGNTGLSLTGNNLANTILGGAGADRLRGGLGNDIVKGGGGNDIFLFGSAAEHSPTETINGEAGTDAIRFISTTAGQTLVLSNKVTGVESAATANATGSTTGTTALNIDASAVTSGLQLIGNNGANTITGTAFVDTLSGNGGDDTFLIKSSAHHGATEAIQGAAGTDAIRFTSTTAGQTLMLSNLVTGVESVAAASATGSTTGTTALNINASAVTSGLQMIGNAGANTLTGSGFNDLVVGNGGKDLLRGGAGSDTFRFLALADSGLTVATCDRILDFTAGDKIDVSLIDAISGGSDNAFTLNTGGAFLAGQIRQTVIGSDLFLEFNVDGTVAAEMSLLVLGRTLALGTSDFTL